MDIWIMAIAAFVIGAVAFSIRHVKQGRALGILKKRDVLSDEEIFNRFYALSNLRQSDVTELWHEIARMLKVPPEKMRPEDRFGEEVGAYWLTSEELDELALTARRRAERLSLSVDLALLKTVDDYVKCFAAPLENVESRIQFPRPTVPSKRPNHDS